MVSTGSALGELAGVRLISVTTASTYGEYNFGENTPVWKLQYVHLVWQNGTWT
jgi:hypothetical protein